MKIGFLGKPVKSADYTISHPSVQVLVGLFVCDDELVRHRVIGTRGVRVPPLAHVGQVVGVVRFVCRNSPELLKSEEAVYRLPASVLSGVAPDKSADACDRGTHAGAEVKLRLEARVFPSATRESGLYRAGSHPVVVSCRVVGVRGADSQRCTEICALSPPEFWRAKTR